jgi:AmmeMemoRadiSam system protein A
VGSRIIADPDLTAADCTALLACARVAVASAVAGDPLPAVPTVPGAALRRGAFVTLTVDGVLHGCLGRVQGDLPLGEVVRRMAAAAALDDPRFPPLARDELGGLKVEISVLTGLVPLLASEASGILIGRHGLMVRRGGVSGLLLPQVAVEHRWSAEEFLAATCRKAGLPPAAWRRGGTDLFTFEAEIFSE